MEDAINLCYALAQADIWIELHPETQALIIGPTDRVQAHPELLHQVREQKQHILEALQETLAYQSSRRQQWPLSDGNLSGVPSTSLCDSRAEAPGSSIAPRMDGGLPCGHDAQEAVAQTLLTRFMTNAVCNGRGRSSPGWPSVGGWKAGHGSKAGCYPHARI